MLDRFTTQYYGVICCAAGQLGSFAYTCGNSVTSQELPVSHPRNIRSQMALKRIGVAAKRQRYHCMALPPPPRQATVASCGMIGISKEQSGSFPARWTRVWYPLQPCHTKEPLRHQWLGNGLQRSPWTSTVQYHPTKVKTPPMESTIATWQRTIRVDTLPTGSVNNDAVVNHYIQDETGATETAFGMNV